jgi:hypothetical protein
MREVKKGSDLTQDELYRQALSGDFKDLSIWTSAPERSGQPLDAGELHHAYAGQTPGEYVRKLAEARGAEGLMHPLFRLGVSSPAQRFRDIPKDFFVDSTTSAAASSWS